MNKDELTPEELEAEAAVALPDKEVVSILDLNVDVDLALDLAAPVDLAVAANANVAAPINAAASANVLSTGSEAEALGDQGVAITQGITGDANATANQDSAIDQGNDVIDDGTTVPAPDNGGEVEVGLNDGPLLNVDANVDLDADLAAPVSGAVGVNANVAAPINAAVGANVGSVDSHAIAVAQQDAIINQNVTGDANAVADQQSDIEQ